MNFKTKLRSAHEKLSPKGKPDRLRKGRIAENFFPGQEAAGTEPRHTWEPNGWNLKMHPLEKEQYRPKPPILGFQPLAFGDVACFFFWMVICWGFSVSGKWISWNLVGPQTNMAIVGVLYFIFWGLCIRRCLFHDAEVNSFVPNCGNCLKFIIFTLHKCWIRWTQISLQVVHLHYATIVMRYGSMNELLNWINTWFHD